MTVSSSVVLPSIPGRRHVSCPVDRRRGRPAPPGRRSGGTGSALQPSFCMVLPIPASTAPRSRLLLESCGAVVDSFGSDTLGSGFRRCQSRTAFQAESASPAPVPAKITLDSLQAKLSRAPMDRYTAGMTTALPSTRRRPAQTTIADIARQAGVSVPTVSKVINGRSDVSVETRRRVEEAIQAGGYRRTPRGVRRSPILEVLFHGLDSEWALEIVRGVERVAVANHLALVVSDMHGRWTPGRGWIEGVVARHPTGVIAVFSDLSESMRQQLAARGIPYVVVDPTGEPLHDTPSVGATNWNGGLTATRHLLALGHRRIAVVGGPADVLCSRARIDGYRAAMDEANVTVDPTLISHGLFHVDEGINRGRALLRLPDRPTAIFTGNDLQALGVYQAAREARLHIPEDLSVVGFDDLPVARWVGPPLTTVRQPLVEMAVAAAELVLEMANGDAPSQARLELATELVVRESTAPPA